MLWRLWTIWDATGRDPYCTLHGLTDDFVPFEGGGPMPPPYPDRHRDVLYAFGQFSQERKEQLAGVKRRRPRKQREE